MDELLSSIEKVVRVCYLNKYEEITQSIGEVIDKIARIDGLYEALLPILTQINSALEVNDYVSVADYFNYGVKQILNDKDIHESILYPYSELIPDVDEDVFYLESLLDEEPVLCINIDNKKERINSLYSPENEAKYCFENLEIKKNTPVVCLFGIGTGILAEKILNYLSRDSRLFIYEPERKIIDYIIQSGENQESGILERKVMARVKKIKEDERVTIFYENDSSRSFYLFLAEKVQFSGLVGLVHLIHNGYRTIYSQSCLRFYKQLNDFRAEMLTNKNTEDFFKDEYVKNAFKNMRFCRKMNLCSELANIIPSDIPAIIVSAGPSLDKNIEDLRKAKGHFLIVAVDTAVKYLLNKNIIPDITVTADPYKPADYYSDERIYSVPCIFTNNANSQILEKITGRMFLIDGRKEYIELLLNTMNIDTAYEQGFGGSVATVAFSSLVSIKIKNIILIGQDLAFSGTSTHAGGTVDGSNNEKIYVEDINGNQILSRSDWVNYLKWFEDAIRYINAERPDIRVIDATEGGAKIHGSEIMTLVEAMNLYRDDEGNLPLYNFGEEIKRLPELFDDEGYKKLCDKHRSEIRKIQNIKADAYEAIKICERLIADIKKGSASDRYIYKQNKMLMDIREKLEKSPMYFVINRYAHNFVSDEMVKLELMEGDNKSTQINLIEIQKLSFDAVVKCSDKVSEIAKQYEVTL
ncbi:MAG: motility associated factor glycosyltransferase family protein [Lachnospiraceae bacterium]|nr:motility associated factor glycosyltransferase family protein [Lachnospiraceae bacterium]